MKDGDCIGGYTSQHWDQSRTFKADSSAFLFNLTHSRHFPSKATGTHIYCGKYNGPRFDGGNSELCAYEEPFNGNNNCISFVNKPGY